MDDSEIPPGLKKRTCSGKRGLATLRKKKCHHYCYFSLNSSVFPLLHPNIFTSSSLLVCVGDISALSPIRSSLCEILCFELYI